MILYTKIKRLSDIVFSIIMLILFLPILFIISLIILFTMGKPIIFSQQRGGLNHAEFKLFKFRSMNYESDINDDLLSDEFRITTVGRFLRKTSLDELPTLWNVLIGNMSLVGPRPLLVEYENFYSKEQAKRSHVKPGITGWAQINGRNAISWEKKFILDVWYVENKSIWLDIKILLLTVKKVLMADGINPSDKVIMPRFTGTKGDGG